MKNYLFTCLLILSMAACKNKQQEGNKKSTEPKELADAYKKLKLPFYVVDSTMDAAAKDAGTISLATFIKYIPDTTLNTPFGKDRNLTIYPIGKIDEKSKETYFATYVKGRNQSAIYLSVYDSSRHMVTMPLIVSDNDEKTNTASIDKKLTIVINKEWSLNNVLYYNRTIFAYNNVGLFTTVLTETNEEQRAKPTVANPLDTFPKKYKYSGDYARGDKSRLFIRDGVTANEYLFFVRFQNDNEEEPCNGELRGKFNMISDKTGRFTGNSDPCVLDLIFKGNEVQVKENGSCGNYRGIKCFFNDTYTKRKEAKASTHKVVK